MSKLSECAVKSEVVVPQVHLGGTSAEELERQLADLRCAIRWALTALDAASPNARDYYVLPEGEQAFAAAKRMHGRWWAALTQVSDEAGEVAEAIREQGD